MENMVFTQSRRLVWNLMKKLNPHKSKKTEKRTIISAGTVANKRKKERGMHSPRYKFERNIRNKFQKLYHKYPDADPSLTASVGKNKTKRAINEIKQGKSARTDGIYP